MAEAGGAAATPAPNADSQEAMEVDGQQQQDKEGEEDKAEQPPLSATDAAGEAGAPAAPAAPAAAAVAVDAPAAPCPVSAEQEDALRGVGLKVEVLTALVAKMEHLVSRAEATARTLQVRTAQSRVSCALAPRLLLCPASPFPEAVVPGAVPAARPCQASSDADPLPLLLLDVFPERTPLRSCPRLARLATAPRSSACSRTSTRLPC